MKKKKRFLGKIAEKLFLEYGDNLSNIVIVFPSRRAHIFFIDELSHFIKRPIWLPKFYSIEDIVFQIGGLTPITKLELFFNFYSLYKKKYHLLEKQNCHRETIARNYYNFPRLKSKKKSNSLSQSYFCGLL